MSESWIVQNLLAIIADLSDESTLENISLDAAEGYKWRIELIYRDLLAKEVVDGTLDDSDRHSLEFVAQAYTTMSQYVDTLECHPMTSTSHLSAELVLTGAVGRPTFEIPRNQLQYLIESRFSVPQIADLLGVSVSTIRRRMTLYNLSIQSTYSSITDDELDELIAGIQCQFPNWGNRQMYGHLLSRGIRIQYHRVRETQSRIDPEGCMLRRLRNLRRRCYSVQGPQHLWHIDGNHKLIR